MPGIGKLIEPKKRCCDCDTIKLVSEFNTRNGRRPGQIWLRSYCKKCGEKRNRKWAKNNISKYRAMRRRSNHKKRYTAEEVNYESRLIAQGGICATCGRQPGVGKSSLHVDHDHETGKIRGLLCQQCNRALGLVKDNIATLAAMIDYLIRAKE